MKAQALSDDGRMAYMRGRKTLEINPSHPIIKEKSEDDAGDEDTKRTALIMYETALLESGFMFEEPQASPAGSSTWSAATSASRQSPGGGARRRARAEAEAQEAPKDEL